MSAAENETDVPVSYFRHRNATRWTFADPVVRGWVERRLAGRTLNLFAGATKLTPPPDGSIVRNDADDGVDADHHVEVGPGVDLTETFGAESFDTVVLDPPWSVRKGREKYEGRFVDNFTEMKEAVAPLVRPGGRTILVGYDTSGFGPGRGFDLDEVAVVNYTGNHNDVLLAVEQKVQATIGDSS